MLLPIILINVGCLGNNYGRLGTTSPPCVGVDLVILDGDVVTIIHSDTTVGAVMDLVVVDEDVVARPRHNSSAEKLFGFDQSVCLSFCQSDTSVGADNLQSSNLYTMHLVQN